MRVCVPRGQGGKGALLNDWCDCRHIIVVSRTDVAGTTHDDDIATCLNGLLLRCIQAFNNTLPL